jgi:glycosyltransferase involved in cell wall biosynthesis
MLREVSVLLPFHRVDAYLEAAVESVLNSKNVKVQLILIDDRKIKVDDNYSRLSSVWTGGKGYSAALNEGKYYATGENMALMNSDDLVSRDRLAIQARSIEEGECDVSVSRLLKVNKSGVPVFSLGGNTHIKNPSEFNFLYGSHLANASWVSKNDFWQQNMIFPSYGAGSDWILGQELIKKFRFQQLKRRLYFYRTHTFQITKHEKYNSDFLGKVWQDLSRGSIDCIVPQSFGLVLTFPTQFTVNRDEISYETVTNLEKWSSTLMERSAPSDHHLIRLRLGFLSYVIWRTNPKVHSMSPYLKELIEIFLKSRMNALLTPQLSIKSPK